MNVKQIAENANKQLTELGAKSYYSKVNLKPNQDGSAHIENLTSDMYRYVYSEKGKEYNEKITDKVEDIYYWIYSDATFNMACDWEVKNRIEGQDFRILLFEKQLELLSIINYDYAKRKKEEIKNILK